MSSSAASESLVALSPKEWREFPLEEIKSLSHDTKMFRVKLPSPEHETGLTTASCLMLQGKSREGDKDVARPYTPTTLNSTKGYFELVIKTYPQGNVSSYMHGLKIGDAVKIKGPFPKISVEPNMKKRIGMICGGTGINPMYQCVLELLSHSEDATEITLLYGNKTPDDILLKSELDSLAAQHKRFNVVYLVDKDAPGWKGGVGHVSPREIELLMPPPSEDNLIFVCGPPGLMKAVSGDKAEDKSQGPIGGMLKEKGYSESMVYKF